MVHPARRDGAGVPARAGQPAGVDRTARSSYAVVSAIRSQITRGDLARGDRLPAEAEALQAYGTSRTSWREALRVLDAEGLVTVRRGRNGGPVVTTPTVERLSRVFTLLLQIEGAPVMDVHDALAVVEPRLAGRLAQRRDARALAELRAAIDHAAALADDPDGARFGEAAAAVHEKLFEHAGEASLALFARLLREVITRFYRTGGRATTVAERRRAARAYQRFYLLVEAGDAEGAQRSWELLMTYPARRATEPRLGTLPPG